MAVLMAAVGGPSGLETERIASGVGSKEKRIEAETDRHALKMDGCIELLGSDASHSIHLIAHKPQLAASALPLLPPPLLPAATDAQRKHVPDADDPPLFGATAKAATKRESPGPSTRRA